MSTQEDTPKPIIEAKARGFIGAVNEVLPPPGFPTVSDTIRSSSIALRLLEGYFEALKTKRANAQTELERRSVFDRELLGRGTLWLLGVRAGQDKDVIDQMQLPEGMPRSTKAVFGAVAGELAPLIDDPSFQFDWPERSGKRRLSANKKLNAKPVPVRPMTRAEYLAARDLKEDRAAFKYKQKRDALKSDQAEVQQSYDARYSTAIARLVTTHEEEAGFCKLLNLTTGLRSFPGAEQAARDTLLQRVKEARRVQEGERLLRHEELLILFLAGMETGRRPDGTRSLVASKVPVRLDGLKARLQQQMTAEQVDSAVLSGLQKLARLRGESA